MPIASVEGTRNRSNTLENHLKSQCHIECEIAHRLESMQDKQKDAPMEVAVSKANKQMVDYIGKLMIQIYVDAKRLNLSARSWPARYIANEASHAYNSSIQNSVVLNDIKLQYVNAPGHLELMTTIVESDRSQFVEKITNSLALSLRVDGSIDFTQIDKIYVMAKLINLDGSDELILIGIAEQNERYAQGLTNAVIKAMKTIVGDEKIILNKISSICTDGTNVNIGEKNSLWTLLQKEIESAGSEIPVQKFWCAAHRSELVWKDTAKHFSDMDKIFSSLSKISSFFHCSSIRLSELKQVALEKDLKILNLPKLFEIRWSQFTFTLLKNSMVSWEALAIYFGKNLNDAQCAGFYNFLTKLKNLKLIAFLADITFSFQRFQKQLQSDKLTIVSMQRRISSMVQSLRDMEGTELPGGFESALKKKIKVEADGKIFVKSVEVFEEESSRRVRVQKTFDETRKEIIQTIIRFLDERFSDDEELFKTIEPFINFDKTADIEKLHSLVSPDLSLPNLHLQYEECANDSEAFQNLSVKEIVIKLSKTPESRENYMELITTFARIEAYKPHETDVERCISANNLLKTKLRSRISLETENKYLYIRFNMPSLANWNPTDAAKRFVSQKSRRNIPITSENERTKQQPHFKGIFPEANAESDDEGDEPKSNKDVFDF